MPKNKPIGKSAAGVNAPLLPAEILAGLEEAVVAVDTNGSVVYANAAATTVFEDDPADPEVWADALRRNPWLAAGIDSALDAARSHIRHQIALERRGGHVTVGVRIAPLFGIDGGLRGAICLLLNETSLETLTENLRRVDKLRELGTVASGLAHEIKNPLGGILGAAQLLRGEAISQDARECVELIERDVRRINRLMEGLLDFGNARPLAKETINLHRLIDGVLKGLERDPIAGGHAIQRDYDPSLPDFAVAPDAIHQVILNLVKNALEASPPGMPVVVRTRVDIASRQLAKRAALVEVQNEGPSMSTETKERLFTPFFTTKSTGTGLGLLVSLRIVREHGGSMDITSDNGKTVFSIALPLNQEPEK